MQNLVFQPEPLQRWKASIWWATSVKISTNPVYGCNEPNSQSLHVKDKPVY